MPKTGGSVLTAEQEKELLKPIDQKIGSIQTQIDELRANGTNKVISTLSAIESTKRDKSISAEERTTLIEGYKTELELAKKVESENNAQVSKLIAEAEAYLKEHYKSEYLEPVKASCAVEKIQAKQNYEAALDRLKKEHEEAVRKTSDAQKSRTRSTFTRTVSLTLRSTIRKIFSASKIVLIMHSVMSITSSTFSGCLSLLHWSLRLRSGRTTSTPSTPVHSCFRTVYTLLFSWYSLPFVSLPQQSRALSS